MDKRYYIFLALTGFVCLAFGGIFTAFFLYGEKGEETPLQSFRTENFSHEERESDCHFFVDVSGAVKNPGVVCVHEGAIVNDAIQKAGDINPQAYAFKYVAQRINLARELDREEKIYIPFHDDVVCNFLEDESVKKTSKIMDTIGLSDKTSKAVVAEEDGEQKKIFVEEEVEKEEAGADLDCININTDSKNRIMELQGIGEARATDIILGRPYSKVEEMKNVSGIGEVTFNNIKDFICI